MGDETAKGTIVFEGENLTKAAAAEVDAEFQNLQVKADEFNKTVEKGFGSASTKIGATTKQITSQAAMIEKTTREVEKQGGAWDGAAKAASGLASQAKMVVGQITSYLGAAGLVAGAVVGITAAVYEWASAQDEVNKELEKANEELIKRGEIFADIMDQEVRHRTEDRKYASEKKSRDEAAHQETMSTIASTMNQEIALAELYKSDERAINDIRLEGLGYQLDELRLAGKDTREIENQIALLEEKNAIMDAGNRRTLEPKKGGPNKRAGWKNAPTSQRREDSSGLMGEGLAGQAEANQQAVLDDRADREAEIQALALEAEIERLGETKGHDAEIHALRVKQIEDEADARDKLIDRAERGGADPAEVAHERKMSMIEAEMDLRRSAAEESKRIAAEQAEALAAQLELIESTISTIESVNGELQGKLNDWRAERQANDAAELDAWISHQQTRTSTQVAQLDREIAANRGNVDKTRALERRKAALERQSAAAIEKAKVKHAEKVEKVERRQKGLSLLLEGALAVGRAAASYPNVPQMVALAAAAAINFAFGAAVLSGGTPGAGGASLDMGGGGTSGAGTERTFSEAASTPGSKPGEGDRRGKMDDTSRGGGGTVYNGNVSYYAMGSIDKEAVEQFAIGAQKAGRSREKATAG